MPEAMTQTTEPPPAPTLFRTFCEIERDLIVSSAIKRPVTNFTEDKKRKKKKPALNETFIWLTKDDNVFSVCMPPTNLFLNVGGGLLLNSLK